MISLGVGLRMWLFNGVSQSLDLYYYYYYFCFSKLLYITAVPVSFGLEKKQLITVQKSSCLANEVGDWIYDVLAFLCNLIPQFSLSFIIHIQKWCFLACSSPSCGGLVFQNMAVVSVYWLGIHSPNCVLGSSYHHG